MLRAGNKKSVMSPGRAEEIGANALAFLAADPARMMQFLQATGVSLDDLRQDAGSARVLTAVLDHLEQDESLLLVFTSSIGLPPEEVGRVKQKLTARFAERVILQNLFVPTANVDVLEIFDPSVNKWEGIKLVAHQHGIAHEQIIAIGDDFNDLSMIQAAGLGVAMGNARPEIKAVAKRIIGTNHEEGLAAFLEELVAQHAVISDLGPSVSSGGAAA